MSCFQPQSLHYPVQHHVQQHNRSQVNVLRDGVKGIEREDESEDGRNDDDDDSDRAVEYVVFKLLSFCQSANICHLPHPLSLGCN